MSKAKVTNVYEDSGDLIILSRDDAAISERRVRAEHVTWHHARELRPALMRDLKSCELIFRISTEGEWARISWADEACRRRGRRDLREEEHVESYEGDVDPVMLWLVENQAEVQKPRRCYLDLEADSRVPLSRKEEMRVLSWAVVDGESGEERTGVLARDDEDAERALLEELVGVLGDYDQVCIWEGNWKGGEFDSVLLPARLRRVGLDGDPRRWILLNQLAVWDKMNFAESGAETESLSLENIAHEQLGEGKERVPDFVAERFGDRAKRGLGGITWELWEAGGEFRELLRRYNARDAKLQWRLEQRKGFVRLFQEVCGLCGILPENRSLQTTRQMDGALLRLGRERGMRFPTKRFVDDAERKKFRGAFVLDARGADPAWRKERGLENGILRDVHVCDFSGMYPSNIVSWNLSTETKCPPEVRAEYDRTGVLPPNVALSPLTGLLTYTDRPGVLPDMIRRLMGWRKEFADLAASLTPGTAEWLDAMAKSNAAKVTANAFFGGAGSPDCRFNDPEVAESIAQNGAFLIQRVIAAAEARRMDPVAGDTDSCFVMSPSRDAFAAFVSWCNRVLIPQALAECGCRENVVKLAFEKTFGRLVVQAKKFYVASWSHYKGQPAKAGSKPEIKGVAYRRGDKGRLVRELQARVIDLLVGGGLTIRGEDGVARPVNEGLCLAGGAAVERPTDDVLVYEAVIRGARDHVMGEPLDLSEVRVAKGLSKPLREYEKDARDAHVRVARILASRGAAMTEGVRVEYVVVDGSKSPQVVIPAEDYAGECDRAHLWERVFAPTRDLLAAAFPDVDWDRWGDVRPQKPGRKAPKVAEEQLGLQLAPFLGSASGRPDAASELAVTAWSQEPMVLRVPEEIGEAGFRRVRKAVAANPGARPLHVVIQLRSGKEAVLDTSARVTGGRRLVEMVERAIMGS